MAKREKPEPKEPKSTGSGMNYPEHRIPNKLLKRFAQMAKSPEERREYTDAIKYNHHTGKFAGKATKPAAAR